MGWESGWSAIRSGGIDRLESYLDGELSPNTAVFGAAQYSQLYTTVYNMCTQRSPYNWAEQLYKKYGETLTRYLQQTVVRSLAHKSPRELLREMTLRWENHKIYVKWLDRFFAYFSGYVFFTHC